MRDGGSVLCEASDEKRTKFREARRRARLRDLKTWYSENPETALYLGGQGSRGSIEGIERYYCRSSGEVFMRSHRGNCVHASLVNAVWRLRGKEHADEALLHTMANKRRFRSLKSATKYVQDMRLGVELRRVPKGEREGFLEDSFAWVLGRDEGVMVVRIMEEEVVDHCVVVDAGARIIVDGCEKYPLELSMDTLRLCGGSEATNIRIAEVSFLVKQRSKSSGSKRKYEDIS